MSSEASGPPEAEGPELGYEVTEDSVFFRHRDGPAMLMLRQGIHPKIVQERLGHSRVGVTLSIYSHVTPGLQQAAALRLEEAVTVTSEPEASLAAPARCIGTKRVHWCQNEGPRGGPEGLIASVESGGRYWNRTSDPLRVKLRPRGSLASTSIHQRKKLANRQSTSVRYHSVRFAPVATKTATALTTTGAMAQAL